mgnify:CR=1 FL=1
MAVQLVAVGAQDAYITGEPEVSFFRNAYKRHTNFSMQNIEQVFQGNPSPGGISTVEIQRKGDLLSYMTIVALETTGDANVVYEWSNYIDKAELIIGGQVVDTQDSVFSEDLAVDLLAATHAKSYPASLHGGQNTKFYPLRFFCCENWQNLLPLVALQYHTVEIRITWASTLPTNLRFEFCANFVFLDTQERAQFASQEEINMLIYQVQKSVPSGNRIQEINFNHPVKFLAISTTQDSDPATSADLAYGPNRFKLEANGTDIYEYRLVDPYYTEISRYFHTEYSSGTGNLIYIPFCIASAKLQPTGTLNFSRLDSFRIHSSHVPFSSKYNVYGVNYNVLKIKNGMGAVVFAN